MHTFAKKITRALLALGVALSGLALTGSLASAASIELCAVPGTATLTGTISVPIWGFGIPTTPGDCTTATAILPGPMLSVSEGDTVTITVHNALPGTRTLTFEVPGIVFDVGPTDAAVGATVTRTFTASAPGTYLYQSGGDAGRQEAMGLYGALIVRSGTPGQAYDDAATAFGVEATLVLSQIDPNFNATPDTFNMYDYLATYWLINGKAYPDTLPIISPVSCQTLLLRYLNAGYDNTTMTLLGLHEHVLARDARLLNNPFDADAETIPAGGTEDTIVTIPPFTSASPSVNGFPLYNRQLHVTNGSTASIPYPYATPGGMMTFIQRNLDTCPTPLAPVVAQPAVEAPTPTDTPAAIPDTPTPTDTPTDTPVVIPDTPTPTDTPTNTPAVIPDTPTPTDTPTDTPAVIPDTPTPTNTPAPADTLAPTPTDTNTPLPTNTPVPTNTSAPAAFPSTGVLDNFNRASGPIGSNWSGDIVGNTTDHRVANPVLDVGQRQFIIWKPTSFGANQEAYATFNTVSGDEMDLILKASSTGGVGSEPASMVEVVYRPASHRVEVWTKDNGSWALRGTISVTFANGNQLGARVSSTGQVTVYKNGAAVGAPVDISSWSHNGGGGYIGLWFVSASNAVADDFGGGTAP